MVETMLPIVEIALKSTKLEHHIIVLPLLSIICNNLKLKFLILILKSNNSDRIISNMRRHCNKFLPKLKISRIRSTNSNNNFNILNQIIISTKGRIRLNRWDSHCSLIRLLLGDNLLLKDTISKHHMCLDFSKWMDIKMVLKLGK